METPAASLSCALRRAPGHPLCLAATVLLLLNDHLLKASFPGLLTGKLSDIAWLVVAPVVLAALLSLARVSARVARWGALAAAGVAFAALQLWPPLGDAWCALFGGRNVADAGDLWCLPALAGAWLCWRGAGAPRAPRRWALVLATAACLATTSGEDFDWRWPCDGTTDWDPAVPLTMHWAHEYWLDPTAPGLAESTWLEDERGWRVPSWLSWRHDVLLLCPVGGLEPERVYVWRVRDVGSSENHLTAPRWAHPGALSFRTGPAQATVPPMTQADCDALRVPEEVRTVSRCDPCRTEGEDGACGDTGDTGLGGPR
jgi:hypothetical protein